jgi:hypothetical protein
MSSQADREPTYADLVIAGKAHYSAIDDFITKWHHAPADSPAASLEVYEFLGLTWEEYRLWGEQPASIRFTFAARKANLPVSELLQDEQELSMAARASNDNDAAKVYEWLLSRHRIPARP